MNVSKTLSSIALSAMTLMSCSFALIALSIFFGTLSF